MSFRVLLIPALLAAAGACAHVPAGEADAPLAARLNVTASGMDVGLSDQAHIAVFAVTPGRGVSLVYPAAHERTTFFAGWSTLGHGNDHSSFTPSLAQFTTNSASTVLVLVASRQPLDVRRFASGGLSLERAMGHEVYRAYDADAVIGGIARLTVAGMDESDWAMDVTAVPVTRSGTSYALLDEGRFPFEQPYVLMHCSTGSGSGVILVHVEFARFACSPPDPPAESDSTASTGTSSSDGRSASRAITRRTFAPADAAAAQAAAADAANAVRHGRRDAADASQRVRASDRPEQSDRRERARESAEASERSRAPARPTTRERSGGERAGGGERVSGGRTGGAGGARHP